MFNIVFPDILPPFYYFLIFYVDIDYIEYYLLLRALNSVV